MPERPESPIPDSKPDAKPAPEQALPEAVDEHVVHHTSIRKKRRKGVGNDDMELQLTSMIDVIFQLLIYFVITANFQVDEGTILATLPGNAADNDTPPPPTTPLLLEMKSSEDGVTYSLRANGQLINGGASELYGYLQNRVSTDMKPDDPVEIKPNGDVRWQHVVNVFNACVRADLEQVGFAPAGG